MSSWKDWALAEWCVGAGTYEYSHRLKVMAMKVAFLVLVSGLMCRWHWLRGSELRAKCFSLESVDVIALGFLRQTVTVWVGSS